jgi:hypothetical protein
MQKDLNVIFPEEITVGDKIVLSLVLIRGKNETTLDFEYLATQKTPTLVLTDYLTGEPLPLPADAFKKAVKPDPKTKREEDWPKENRIEFVWQILPRADVPQGVFEATATFFKNEEEEQLEEAGPIRFKVLPVSARPVNTAPIKVALTEAKRISSPDQLLWVLIRNRTIDFNRYRAFMDSVMCDDRPKPTRPNPLDPVQQYSFSNRLPYHNAASFSLLKYATEYYVMQECGLVPAGLYESDRDINWDLLNNNIISEKVLDDELGRTNRSVLDLSELKDKYLEDLNGEGGYALPYFNLIRQKLQEVPIKEPHELPDILIRGSEFIEDGQFWNDITVSFPPPPGLHLSKACYGISKSKLLGPCMIELLWSYWHEEAGLVQTMNAISRRFQNVRSGASKDPLANFNLDPLRPLSNLLWGYVEDERNRLSITRRNLEYQYEYGISLIGNAVTPVSVAEHRTHFIRAFHNLLKACLDFYAQANFTTVIPDAFPLLHHLREVHLLLAEGAHNQYGDLAWTSRVEMLTQQWLLSRPEMREFIGSRIMVPYAESWMDKVDTMKQLQGWNVPNVTHFHDLAVFGEQLLLSIRFGNWNGTEVGGTNAGNWAHYWRNEVQRYVHAYNSVTGVDLNADVTDSRIQVSSQEDRYVQPAQLIQKQALLQKNRQQQALPNYRAQAALSTTMQVPAPPRPAIPVPGQKKLNG